MPRTGYADHKFNMRRDHAIRRARERYALNLDHNQYAFLNLQIRNRKAKRLADIPERRAAYQPHYQGKQLIAVYSHHRHQIITFLSKDQDVYNARCF